MKLWPRFKQKRSKSDKKDDVLRDNYDDELQDEVTDTQSPEKKPSHWQLLGNLFKWDSHRKIERFMFTLATAFSIMVIGFGWCIWHNYRVSQQQSQTLTSTSSNIAFSKSGATMALGNIILTSSGKTAYLPIKFGDMTQLPGSADHFIIGLSATAGSLKYKPYGQILVYGTTGYGMMIFHSNTGFKNQPVTVYLKNNANLTGNDSTLGSTQSDADVTALQQKSDVAVFKLNLSPSSKVVDKYVPDGNAKPDLVYNSIFGSIQRNKILQKIAADQSAIKSDVSLSSGLYQQLSERGYKMPAAPAFITDSKWRPSMMVDPATGQIGDSNNKVSSNGKSAFLTKQKLKYPDALYKVSGNKTTKLQAQVDGDLSPDIQSWEKLKLLWNDVYNKKYDIYVKQYASWYANTQTVFKNGSSYSVSAPSNFYLLGDISVQ